MCQSPVQAGLPRHFHANLALSGRTRAGNRAEERRIHRAVGQQEVGVVQHVEHLEAHLQVEPWAESNRRESAVSRVLQPGTDEDVAAGVAERAGRRARQRRPVLNHRLTDRSSPSRPGSPTRLGRWLPRLPMPATSELITGVNGEPLVSVKMALSCQPRARTFSNGER